MPHSDAGTCSPAEEGAAGVRFVSVAAGLGTDVEGVTGVADMAGAADLAGAGAKFAGTNVPFLRFPLE